VLLPPGHQHEGGTRRGAVIGPRLGDAQAHAVDVDPTMFHPGNHREAALGHETDRRVIHMTLVELEADGPVRKITLNAPDRLNALDWPLLEELRSAVEQVAADEDARALVVAGDGKAFCSGANLESLFGDTSRPADVLREHLMNVYASFLGIRNL